MSLIICAVYDTEENGRSEYTEKTLVSLAQTVNWDKHRLIIVDNGSCERTKSLLRRYFELGNTNIAGNFGWKINGINIITNTENLGTARAINQGLKLRQSEEFCCKIDNDVVINQLGWVEEMEAAIERDPTIGIIGLKRKDIEFDGEYIALPHVAGQRWITVEGGGQIMGTCTLFNWRLIDKIGGMIQPSSVYGFDDSIYDLRSKLAGFWNCYLPHIDISHIDTGENSYTQVKQQQAGVVWDEYHKMHADYVSGVRPLWEDFE